MTTYSDQHGAFFGRTAFLPGDASLADVDSNRTEAGRLIGVAVAQSPECPHVGEALQLVASGDRSRAIALSTAVDGVRDIMLAAAAERYAEAAGNARYSAHDLLPMAR